MENARPHLSIRLAVWLGLQLLVLAVSAAQVPLYAKHPEPRECMAVHSMLVGQILFGSVFAGFIFSDGLNSIAIIASSLPMLVLAGGMAQKNAVEIVLAMVLAVVTLGCIAAGARCPRCRLLNVLYVAGGAALYYWAMESGSKPVGYWFGPLVACIDVLNVGFSSLWQLGPEIIVFSAIILCFKLARARKIELSTGSPRPVH